MAVSNLQAVFSAWRTSGSPAQFRRHWKTILRPDFSVNSDEEKNHSFSERLSRYGDEQIKNLVRQTFLSRSPKSVRQVMLCGINDDEYVPELCERVALALAKEVASDACLVGGEYITVPDHEASGAEYRETNSRQSPSRISSNLWRIPTQTLWGAVRDPVRNFCKHLENLNQQFEFTVIQGPPVCEQRSALMLGRFCDGVILVIEAGRTRRAAAQQAKELLSAAGIPFLGTVLCNRSFPIPEGIYRRV